MPYGKGACFGKIVATSTMEMCETAKGSNYSYAYQLCRVGAKACCGCLYLAKNVDMVAGFGATWSFSLWGKKHSCLCVALALFICKRSSAVKLGRP